MIFLKKDEDFPDTHLANEEGILAVGGDLSLNRLKEAYSKGIFPWYNDDSLILWWAPDPRFVLFAKDLKVSKSMKQVIRSGKFTVTFDREFERVIRNCKTSKREGQSGTWITQDMEQAYINLHRQGIAHSVEVWFANELVGGLYGVALGKMFFGESMYTHMSNASKYGFIQLVQKLEEKGFDLIDCQDYTAHLESLGAHEISRDRFEKLISHKIKLEGKVGQWSDWLQ
ncbi:leucyl/phenylalanyl-tRNA--protein transferase [bacterium SCSIO 12643]|nr:leucyl/phenylalanyl-tRNA--protein transferase [bacterium SCSIO 12643]